MIIQLYDGSLVDAQTSARWTTVPFPGDGDGDKMGVALLGPPVGRERVLHWGTGAECRAFLNALAIELRAVRWDTSKRAFVAVGGDNE
jgi:hypothetical protein